ncbi:MAG TPA: hypothetical protein VH251_07485 [Verrucomicrobiae bacterium]|jgi:hypothetical protein|nr:hypothetical protein [Verrucomicrobiae bacterium]
MNFGKLLGVGKSFFGSDPAAAYRLNKRICLPKFNDGNNPFVAKSSGAAAVVTMIGDSKEFVPAASKMPNADSDTAKSPDLTIAQAVAIAQKAKVQKTQPPYAFKPMPKAPVPMPATKVVAKPSIAQPVAKPAKAGWTTRLNPFRPPEPVAPPVAEQTELSLDTVKVVHNDLADADVEIVPVKSHTEQPAAPMLPPARQAWEYMGENLLKSS